MIQDYIILRISFLLETKNDEMNDFINELDEKATINQKNKDNNSLMKKIKSEENIAKDSGWTNCLDYTTSSTTNLKK